MRAPEEPGSVYESPIKTKKILVAVITVCAFLPRTSIAITLELDDARTISADGSCAKIQSSGGDTFVYNHEKSTLLGIDKVGHEYKLANVNQKQRELVQKTKRAAQTGKQYTKFLPNTYQRKIKDLTRGKNKVKRMGTTLTGSKSKTKNDPHVSRPLASIAVSRASGVSATMWCRTTVTLGWFCGAQWRKVFAKPEWATLLGLRRLVTDISKVAGGEQAHSSFAFTAFRIKAVPIAWNTETGVGQCPRAQGYLCQLTNP